MLTNRHVLRSILQWIIVIIFTISLALPGHVAIAQDQGPEGTGEPTPSEPNPTSAPTEEPTQPPTEEPTTEPTAEPTLPPTEEPTLPPIEEPTQEPTQTQPPVEEPVVPPTEVPTETVVPTAAPVQPEEPDTSSETHIDTPEETAAVELLTSETTSQAVTEELQQNNAVVVDTNGDVAPLTDGEAQAVLEMLDPVGCPDGHSPTWMGGDGIGCTQEYTKIQDALDDDNVQDGWTIYIQKGHYDEQVLVQKSVKLVGEEEVTVTAFILDADIISDPSNVSAYMVVVLDGGNVKDAVNLVQDGGEVRSVVEYLDPNVNGGLSETIIEMLTDGVSDTKTFKRFVIFKIVDEPNAGTPENPWWKITTNEDDDVAFDETRYLSDIVIDGFSQPGASLIVDPETGIPLLADIKIQWENSNAVTLLQNAVLQGISFTKIGDMQDLIYIRGDHNVVQYNLIGILPNGEDGVGAMDGLDAGVFIQGNENYVLFNQIANNHSGVFVADGYGNLVAYNQIRNNSFAGISLYNAQGNIVLGNEIYNNVRDGIWMTGAVYSQIEGNYIHDNGMNGIRLMSFNLYPELFLDPTLVYPDLSFVDPDLNELVPLMPILAPYIVPVAQIFNFGLMITGNVIFNNFMAGIDATDWWIFENFDRGIQFSQNSIYNNGGLGIDINHMGVQYNDEGDVDTGTNDLLNTPVIEKVVKTKDRIVVMGYAPAGAVVEFFIAAPDESGFGEGAIYLFAAQEGSCDDFDATIGSYSNAAGTETTQRFLFSFEADAFGDYITPDTFMTSTSTRMASTVLVDENNNPIEELYFNDTSEFGLLSYGVIFDYDGDGLPDFDDPCPNDGDNDCDDKDDEEDDDPDNPTILESLVAGLGQLFIPPTGSQERIAFHTNRDSNFEIYTMNADGSNPTRLTYNPTADTDPAWSLDSSKIVFTSDRDRNNEIYIMNPDGSLQLRLTDHPASDTDPVFSPDGMKVAFVSNRDGNDEIYVMNVDGTNPVRLTDNPASDTQPAWSLDGRKIAFTSDRDGNQEIYMMSIDGTELVNLTNDPANDSNPTFAPFGRQIAFTSDRNSFQKIYIMNIDGSELRMLNDVKANETGPAWSFDGQFLMFVSFFNGTGDLIRINTDGTDFAPITNVSGDNLAPAWKP